MSVSEDNIIELTIKTMEEIEQFVDKTGLEKKAYVMQALQDTMDDEIFQRYEYFIGITIDFIVKVSKKGVKLNLNNKLKKCFLCI